MALAGNDTTVIGKLRERGRLLFLPHEPSSVPLLDEKAFATPSKSTPEQLLEWAVVALWLLAAAVALAAVL